MATKVYDANQVSIIIGTINVEEGWDDGEFITIEFNEDQYIHVKSTDGMSTRSKSNNVSAILTLKLMQSSPSNDALSALWALDQLGNNGAGIVPLRINDKSGRSVYTALECWISKHPDVAFDREPTAREWTIEIADLVPLTGGN
jgi:hypothetical protein